MNGPRKALLWAGAVYSWLALSLISVPMGLVAMVGYHLVLCLWAARHIGPALPAGPAVARWRLAAGFALGLATVLALDAAAGSAMPSGPEKRALMGLLGVAPPLLPLTLAWFVAVNPWAEEYAWRGRVRPALARWGNYGEALAAVLFGGYHAATAWFLLGPLLALPAAVLATVAALVLGVAARDREGLRLAVAIHAGANLGLAWIARGMLASPVG